MLMPKPKVIQMKLDGLALNIHSILIMKLWNALQFIINLAAKKSLLSISIFFFTFESNLNKRMKRIVRIQKSLTLGRLY